MLHCSSRSWHSSWSALHFLATAQAVLEGHTLHPVRDPKRGEGALGRGARYYVPATPSRRSAAVYHRDDAIALGEPALRSSSGGGPGESRGPGHPDHVQRERWANAINPAGLTPEKRAIEDYTVGTVIIDACKPYRWRHHWDEMFKVSDIDEEVRRQVAARWEHVLGPLITEPKPVPPRGG